MPRLLLLCLLAAVLLAACEAAPSTPPAGDGSDAAAPGTDAVADITLPDLFLGDGLEAQCPGASGCSCAADSDCSSGVCAETPLGLRCAVLCGAGCPAGTTCKTFSGSGDPVLYCSPVGVRQCAPCQSSQDCVGPWGAAAVCASAGNAGSFCASVCQVSADCPAGTQCVSVSGTSGKVCAPAEGLGACTCSQWATTAKATTSCLVVSGTQACPGSRSCGEAGLSVCSQLAGEQCFDAGCKDAQDGSPCDDADPCTQSECKAGVCTATDTDLCQCQTSADCPDDADLCNGKPFCDKSQTPYQCKTNPASVVTCPKPTNPCDVATCQADTGSCLVTTAPDTTPCDDGKACTTGDVCMAGKCVSGTVTCACAVDADCTPYEDGNLCNGTLFCNKAKGQCQINPKTVVVCATGLDTTCEQTLCEPTTGACVLSQAPTSTLCDDGNPCSASDHCKDGQCVSSADICPCEQDADCASSEDNNLCNGTLYCDLLSHTCKVNPATVVSCPIDSDNPCSPMECQPQTGQCKASPLLSGSCDDANPCTAKGTCAAGMCVPGPDLCQCQSTEDCAVFDDTNPCNGTLYCDAQTGTCKVNLAEVPICPPGSDACTANVCDPTSGACKLVPAKDGTWCTDDEACTKGDQCDSGACKAGVSVCACLTDGDCAALDDGDPCNGWYFCDKTDGAPQCVLNPQPKAGCADATSGEDADAGSTADSADAEDAGDAAGQDGALSDASDPADAVDATDVDSEDDVEDVDDTGDAADDASDAGDACAGDCSCAPEGSPCDDNNPCTLTDLCTQATCIGSAKDCTDNLPNTTGICSPDNGQCIQIYEEICNGIDDNNDGTTDNVMCGGSACYCQNGVAVCSDACTTCPDPGDRAVKHNMGGLWLVTCAHDYPAWGIAPDSPTTFEAGTDGTVIDTMTGLQWEQPASMEFQSLAVASLRCASLDLANQKDWRMPTITELESLVDYGTATKPPINATYFPGTLEVAHWSETPLLGNPQYAFGVYFALGSSGGWDATGGNIVARCVRNAQAPQLKVPAQRWAVGLDVTADAATRLFWQGVAPTDDGGTFTHANATVYCDNLNLGGSENWRLPTVRELRSLVDFSRTSAPVLSPELFTLPDIGSWLWSSSLPGASASSAWAISTYNGTLEAKPLGEANRVLCVRASQCGDGLCDPSESSNCYQDCGCADPAATPPLVKYYTYQPMTDLLLVIDDSGSMQEEQVKLQAIGSYLMTELNNAGIDFHVGAVTTDMDVQGNAGLLRLGGAPPDQTRVITLATPFASDVLQELIGAGVQGSGTEAGLAAALAALNLPQGLDWQGTCVSSSDCTPPQSCVSDGDFGSVQRCAGPNHPFRRTAAGLDVLFLSDEEDQSSLVVTEVFDQLTQMTKASGRGLGVHAIVGPSTVGCTGADGDGQAGDRYLQLVDLAGGTQGSICAANYTSMVGNMVQAIRARLLHFALGAPVVAASLVVKADGVTCPAGSWTYNKQSNAVRIDPDGACGLSWGDGVEIEAVVDCASGE